MLKNMRVLFTALTLFIVSGMMYTHFQTEAIETGEMESIVEASFPVAPGIHHMSETLVGDDFINSTQMLEVDLTREDVEVVPYLKGGEVFGLNRVGEMIDDLREQGKEVVAGVNGDFFSSVGVPSGLQIRDGEVYTSTRNMKASLLIYPDRTIKMEDGIQMTATLTTAHGETLEFNMFNRTRVPSHSNHAFLFNYRFGATTYTPPNGLEIIVDVGIGNDHVVAGQPVSGEVVRMEETYETPLERGTFVISATGEKAKWLEEHLTLGDIVDIKVTYNKDVNDAVHVLSGNSTLGTLLLKEGEVVDHLLDESDPNNTAKHPRTVLASRDGKLFMMTIDGRQPGHSDGVTLPGIAQYLQSLGMEMAMNIDGGGSTTYYVRQPGDKNPHLMNLPSDQHERPVGNGLLVVTHAEKTDHLAGMNLVTDGSDHLVKGSSMRMFTKGYDASYFPVEVEPKDVRWKVEGNIGTIDKSGLFQATQVGEGVIIAETGGIQAKYSVKVTDAVHKLEISPHHFVMDHNASEQLAVKAFSEDGTELTLTPDHVTWSISNDVGTISKAGVLRTGDAAGVSEITAQYGDLTATAIVEVGVSPMIETFETLDRIQSREIRTVPDSVQLSLVSDPVRFGGYAGKLAYDFTGTPGTSGAYVEFLDEVGQVGRTIPGEPSRFGVWVNGDAKFHHLRLSVTDGNGNNMLWNLTTHYGINWTGWRYVYADVPEGTVYPIKIRNIVIEQGNQHNKTAGALVYDDFHAVYTDENKDIHLLLENEINQGNIGRPMMMQLTNTLKQVDHHIRRGATQQAEKFMNDLIQKLEGESMHKHITKDARVRLKDAALKWLEEMNR